MAYALLVVFYDLSFKIEYSIFTWKFVTVKNLTFALTSDVIGCIETNWIGARGISYAGLSNAVCILKIGPVVSEIARRTTVGRARQ